jgi:hypothetical protein
VKGLEKTIMEFPFKFFLKLQLKNDFKMATPIAPSNIAINIKTCTIEFKYLKGKVPFEWSL